MRPRGVMAGITAGLLLLMLAVANVRADPSPTTPSTTTSAPPTTTVAETTTGTQSTTTTTATTATAVTTTTAPTTTAATTAPIPRAALTHRLVPHCSIAAVAFISPGQQPLAIGPIASASHPQAGLHQLRYRDDGLIVTTAAVAVSSGGCGKGRPERAQLHSLTLFGTAISAAEVTLRIAAGRSVAIDNLRVGGHPTIATAGKRIPLAHWGYLVSDPPSPISTSSGLLRSALAVHLLEPHAGLPAGTVILVAVTGLPKTAPPARAKAGKRATHEPLKITPPLALSHYTFPVLAPAEYIDTYGAFRSDVSGNWHHGDDIFAPLGTPVVAVATGTINRVGWEHLGGWRLWVRDNAGDEFYYAHLSGYTPGDLHSNRVKAGQVIGFIGNTGDAFTTSPHLHFEVHPRSLLHLGYDGAVDPTAYLNHWTHLTHIHAPTPVHPPLPTDPPLRNEARYVFRELLAARHLIRHAPKSSQRPHVRIPKGVNGAQPAARATAPPKAESAAAIPPTRPERLPPLIFALLIGLGAVTLFAATTAIAKTSRLRRLRDVALPVALRRETGHRDKPGVEGTNATVGDLDSEGGARRE